MLIRHSGTVYSFHGFSINTILIGEDSNNCLAPDKPARDYRVVPVGLPREFSASFHGEISGTLRRFAGPRARDIGTSCTAKFVR